MCPVHCCSTDGITQRPSSLATDSSVEQQLKQTQVVGSPVTIHPSIAEENGTNATKESALNQNLLSLEHSNAPSSDIKQATVTGSSSQHSSFFQHSKPPMSPPLSNSVSTGMCCITTFIM